MSYNQIISFGNKIEELAKNKLLSIEMLLQDPKSPVIARQNHPYLTEFLIENIEILIDTAIGENRKATDPEINISMELVTSSSVTFSEFLTSAEGKGNDVIQHITSIMMKCEEPNRFFNNAMKILIFMINFSNGNILFGIDDSYYFLRQVLTLNTSVILDDLMFAILDQKKAFGEWIFKKIDILSLFEELLSNPSYSPHHFRITTFYQRFLMAFPEDNLESFESQTIVQSLFNIGINFSCLNGLRVINFILKKNANTKDEDKLIGLLELIKQNIDFFVESVSNSVKKDGSYNFGILQAESLSILIFYVNNRKDDWIFNFAVFLWEQFLANPTNSFLHNLVLSYLLKIKKYESEFVDFIYKTHILEIIPDIFQKQETIKASFFGHLIQIANVIKEFIENGKIVHEASWSQFSRSILRPKNKIIEKEYLGPKPKQNCYQLDRDKMLKDALDIDKIDDSYDYVLIEEEEEEEEEENNEEEKYE